MRGLAALFLIACATPKVRYAESFILPNDHLARPRALSITEASDDDAEAFGDLLTRRGFDVRRPIAGVPVATRYVAKIDGMCSSPFSAPTLHIDIFDTETRRLIFDAKILDSHNCPDAFYREVAAQLAQWWDR